MTGEPESLWKSSVLLFDDGDDDCPICRFLAGSLDCNDLLRVIEVLDIRLAEAEKLERALTNRWIEDRMTRRKESV